MATLSVHSGLDLPAAYRHQVRAFIRIHWHDEGPRTVDPPLVPPDRRPQHVVVAEADTLFSHARVSFVSLTHESGTFGLACLGDVMTFPASRQLGLGSAVTAAATDIIWGDADTDIGILFCDPAHRSFYARHGWEAHPDLVALRGFDGSREPQEGLPMLLFTSERAQRLAGDVVAAPFLLPGFGW